MCSEYKKCISNYQMFSFLLKRIKLSIKTLLTKPKISYKSEYISAIYMLDVVYTHRCLADAYVQNTFRNGVIDIINYFLFQG